VGARSKIRYEDLFHRYKMLLVTKRGTPSIQKVFKYHNKIIFGETAALQDDATSDIADSDCNSLDEAMRGLDGDGDDDSNDGSNDGGENDLGGNKNYDRENENSDVDGNGSGFGNKGDGSDSETDGFHDFEIISKAMASSVQNRAGPSTLPRTRAGVEVHVEAAPQARQPRVIVQSDLETVTTVQKSADNN